MKYKIENTKIGTEDPDKQSGNTRRNSNNFWKHSMSVRKVLVPALGMNIRNLKK